MMTPVESFIHRENIKNFERRLADRTTDEAQRKMLARLLAEERAKADGIGGEAKTVVEEHSANSPAEPHRASAGEG